MFRKHLLASLILLTFFATAASAQQVNSDSLSLVSKISQDQLKLGKLMNSVDDKTKARQDAAIQAQKSANDNTSAANKLSNDPQNKKDARQADNAASDARSDARKARVASDNLDDLNQNIADLKKRIAKEQKKLDKFVQAGAAAGMMATPAGPDTTKH